MSKAIKFSQGERVLILSLVEVCKRDGWYYGNQERFQSRLDSIRNKILNEGQKGRATVGSLGGSASD